jgi:hypothetical protein
MIYSIAALPATTLRARRVVFQTLTTEVPRKVEVVYRNILVSVQFCN